MYSLPARSDAARHAGGQRGQRHVVVRLRYCHVDYEIRPQLGQRAAQFGLGAHARDPQLVGGPRGGARRDVDPAGQLNVVAVAQVLRPGAAHAAGADQQRPQSIQSAPQLVDKMTR
jgi:hypothetical protein